MPICNFFIFLHTFEMRRGQGIMNDEGWRERGRKYGRRSDGKLLKDKSEFVINQIIYVYEIFNTYINRSSYDVGFRCSKKGADHGRGCAGL